MGQFVVVLELAGAGRQGKELQQEECKNTSVHCQQLEMELGRASRQSAS